MEYIIFVLALIIAYPVFMIAAYVLSRLAFTKDDAFSEFEAKQKEKKQQRDQLMCHA